LPILAVLIRVLRPRDSIMINIDMKKRITIKDTRAKIKL